MPPAITQRARVSGARQDLLEPAVRLVRRPLRDERRGGEAGRDVEERQVQLEQAAGGAEVEAGEDRGEGLEQVGVAPDLLGERPDQRGQEGAHQAQPDAPGQRPRQLVAEGPADGPADAQDVRRAGRAARGRRSPPGRAG